MALTAAMIGGCAMCQDSQDYSPPVIGSTAGARCPPGGRAGSAIAEPVATTAVAPDATAIH